jgi:hypothetical protein
VLSFEPDKKTFRYETAKDGSDIVQASEGGAPVMLSDIVNLDKPFLLDVIVKDDFVDVCINNRYTLFHQRANDYFKGNRLFFFVRKGTVNFQSVSVRRLTN